MTSTQDLLARRNRVFGRGAPLFYSEPLQIVRGEGAFLFDAQGRRYVDLYNNVPCVGHANPRVAEAVARAVGAVAAIAVREAGAAVAAAVGIAARIVVCAAGVVLSFSFAGHERGSAASDQCAACNARHERTAIELLLVRHSFPRNAFANYSQVSQVPRRIVTWAHRLRQRESNSQETRI